MTLSVINNETKFHIGVVEDRDDPLRCGRVRVRVFGLHTPDKNMLPTSDLPWAQCLSPSHSASVSGIGISNTGIVNGSWVAIYFIDDDKQIPIVFGTLTGVPATQHPELEFSTFVEETTRPQTPPPVAQENVLVDGSGVPILDGAGNPIATGRDEIATAPEVRNTTNTQWRRIVIARLGELESSNNYRAVNQFNFIGKYQFGALALIDRGYVRPEARRNSDLNNPASWIGKNDVRSKEDFLRNEKIQEKIMREHVDANYRTLQRIGIPLAQMNDAQRAGFIATAHLLGPGGARAMFNGSTRRDGNGVSGEHYFREGYRAIAGIFPSDIPRRNAAVVPNERFQTPEAVSARNEQEIQQQLDIFEQTRQPRAAVGATEEVSPGGEAIPRRKRRTFRRAPSFGFQDPQGVFPLDTHLGEPDTHRLARGDRIGLTVVANKEITRARGIAIANGQGTWEQAPIPYNARYPFNTVWAGESGHLFEIDNTPGAERLHLYHSSGSFTEINHNGSQTRVVMGDDFVILERNGFVHIQGAQHVKVDGANTLLVEGKTNIQLNGEAVINVHNSAQLNVANDLNVTVGGNFNLAAKGSIQMHSGAGFAADAPAIHLNSGNAANLAGMQGVGQIRESGIETLAPQSVNTRGEDLAVRYEPENEEEFDQFARAAIADSVLSHEELTRPPAVEEQSVHSEQRLRENEQNNRETPSREISAGQQFNQDEMISRFYRLRDLTGGRNIVARREVSEQQIFDNLRHIAMNVLDPLRGRYSNLRINSGLRFANNNSQHNIGQAVDVSFPDLSRARLFDRAQEVISFLPFDQFILEYLTPGGNGWLHISLRTRGANRYQLFTANNHRRVGQLGTLQRIV